MNEAEFSEYLDRLKELRQLLLTHGVHTWPDILSEWLWLAEKARTPSDRLAHMERTRGAFGGMGSLNDINISVKAGDKLKDGVAAMNDANRKLSELRHEIFERVERA